MILGLLPVNEGDIGTPQMVAISCAYKMMSTKKADANKTSGKVRDTTHPAELGMHSKLLSGFLVGKSSK